MPNLTGEQLVAHLQQLFPNLPILHLDDLLGEQNPDAITVPTLYKPFSMEALLGEVRRLLSGRVAGQDAKASGNSPEIHAKGLAFPVVSSHLLQEHHMSDQKQVRLELTEEQMVQVKAATGKDARAIELSAEELEERIAPLLKPWNPRSG